MKEAKENNRLVFYYSGAALFYLAYFLLSYKIISSSKFDSLNIYSIIFPILFSSYFILKGIKQKVTKKGEITTYDGKGPFVGNTAGEHGPDFNLKYISGNKDQNEMYGSFYIGIGVLILLMFLIMYLLFSY